MEIRRLQPTDAAAYRKLRLTSLDDVPEVVGPSAELEAKSDVAALASRLGAYEAEGIHAFGAFMDGRLVGAGGLTQKLNPRFSHKVFFWGLYVLPEFRTQSIGLALVERQIECARNLKGVNFASLQITADNKPARALYTKLGFVSFGIEPAALFQNGKLHDFENMQLDLLSTPKAPSS